MPIVTQLSREPISGLLHSATVFMFYPTPNTDTTYSFIMSNFLVTAEALAIAKTSRDFGIRPKHYGPNVFSQVDWLARGRNQTASLSLHSYSVNVKGRLREALSVVTNSVLQFDRLGSHAVISEEYSEPNYYKLIGSQLWNRIRQRASDTFSKSVESSKACTPEDYAALAEYLRLVWFPAGNNLAGRFVRSFFSLGGEFVFPKKAQPVGAPGAWKARLVRAENAAAKRPVTRSAYIELD